MIDQNCMVLFYLCFMICENVHCKILFFRPVSPTRTKTTTTEKFVSTGPTGMPSGIPGLEHLDAELQNVSSKIKTILLFKPLYFQYFISVINTYSIKINCISVQKYFMII